MRLPAIIAASALAISSATAFAQSPPAGAAADPNTKQNVQPAPSAPNPSDPASAGNPAAASPSAPAGTSDGTAAPAAPGSEGASTGESGSSAPAPAGIPADPNTKQNTQPAPSNMKPADPAAGNNPDARAPTAP